MKKWHVILAAALAMGTMTALTGCGSTEVDLNQYVSLECEGYDSAGTATYTIDWEGLVDDNRKAFDLEEYGGAPLLGLKGLVVKTHGSSKSVEIKNTILQCITFQEQDVVGKITASIAAAKEEG